VGVGGAGISAIARVLLASDFTVSGSDMQANARTEQLEADGATIFIGHAAAQIGDADLLVISSAIPESNPEVLAAHERGIPVFKRADFVGRMMTGVRGVAIAGTHGKTTTTAMIADIAIAAGLDPTVIVGGVSPTIGANGRAGKGDVFIVEADEYDHMFLGLQPTIAVVTNIEHDHPDIYPTDAAYLDAFREFVALLPQDGLLVVCSDDPGVMQLLNNGLPDVTICTYGLDEDAGLSGLSAVELRRNALGGTDFLVLEHGELVGLMRLRVPGYHNVRNAVAAIAVARALGIDAGTIQSALASFGGVGRRFQEIGTVGGVTIVDDYAHHPTEIQMTLQAARQRYQGRRLWAVWQPHTFSRTRLLLEEFAACFEEADRVIALDIYRSREQDTLGMDTEAVIAAMDHPYARHIGRIPDAADYILDRVLPDDVILTLGAGDGNQVGVLILEGLQARVNH
jgi:UDP-N-acetylmuramate--alanine ligase